ncbi:MULTISPECIES: ABC transporter substrate-binding protein [unclassified Polaribacter]|uniref:ABC transporter substrate-binding protein n=1 Tax=unclassified Polaribacter TaxID=196858 RepID=UPI0011BF0DA7|nr:MULTISPECIES: ABC transporter substrate-binding protein [unclassified Polaribacter]TXD52492.1 ABC transporter substrate-binding protein [Polaribacter sp. IC063]TXD60478.1 ABC transporter substrate-binding protein [Polaribacter sp. IC066]
MRYFLSTLIISVFFISCKEKPTSKEPLIGGKSSVKYATGFDIITEGNQKKLIIKKPYQNSDKSFVYVLANATDVLNNIIKVPVKNIVVTSTTHIAMLELLGAENLLTGFPQTRFISSEKTRKRVDNGDIIELGSEQTMNTEKLIELAPELVIGFSLNGNNKVYNTVERTGIPVLYNGDWLEETPLGRAEWIKFFGVLFNKEKEADSIFKSIETSYLKVKELALKAKKVPTIISGNLFKDVWYMPAGESFIANYFKDANTNYIWKNTKGNGSLPLSIESVLDKAQDATYWIGCGLFENKEDMLKSNQYYNSFTAFNQSNIYTYATNKGKTGGLVYFEKSPTRPDLVLKDIIKITNPDLLPDYELVFFEKME